MPLSIGFVATGLCYRLWRRCVADENRCGNGAHRTPPQGNEKPGTLRSRVFHRDRFRGGSVRVHAVEVFAAAWRDGELLAGVTRCYSVLVGAVSDQSSQCRIVRKANSREVVCVLDTVGQIGPGLEHDGKISAG